MQNNAGENSGRNANDVGGNLDATYSSSSELANMISKLNTSTSRSDKVEPINEEGG